MVIYINFKYEHQSVIYTLTVCYTKSMKSQPFVPDVFNVPYEISFEKFILKKLSVEDVKLDYIAVMSSIDVIHKVRGGTWPSMDLTEKEDLEDLYWHQAEFEMRTSFAYTVLNLDKSKCLGCVYIYPTNKPWVEFTEGSDAVINMWVTQEEYDKGLYLELFKIVESWVNAVWPFKQPYYSNIEKP